MGPSMGSAPEEAKAVWALVTGGGNTRDPACTVGGLLLGVTPFLLGDQSCQPLSGLSHMPPSRCSLSPGLPTTPLPPTVQSMGHVRALKALTSPALKSLIHWFKLTRAGLVPLAHEGGRGSVTSAYRPSLECPP